MNNTSPVPIQRALEKAIPNEYVVRLKDDADMTSHLNWLEKRANDGLSTCKVNDKFNYRKVYNAELIGPVLEDLTRRHDVETIIQEFEFECHAFSP